MATYYKLIVSRDPSDFSCFPLFPSGLCLLLLQATTLRHVQALCPLPSSVLAHASVGTEDRLNAGMIKRKCKQLLVPGMMLVQNTKVRMCLRFCSHKFSSISKRKSRTETLGVLSESIWKSNFQKANHHIPGIWSFLFCSSK